MRRRGKAGGPPGKDRRGAAALPEDGAAADRAPGLDLRARVDALAAELEEAREQQAATAEVLKAISSSPGDLAPVFNTIEEQSRRLCDAEISLIAMVDGDIIRLASISGATELGVETVRKIYYPMRLGDETVVARAVRYGAICNVPDILDDPLYPNKEAARVTGFRAGLAVPMVRDGEVLGAIFVARKEPVQFADAQVALLRTFADQAIVAIENVRLFNETRESLDLQTATSEVLKAISRSAFDLKSVLQTLVESAARICDAEKTMITRRIGGHFYPAEFFGFSQEFMDIVRKVPIETDRRTVAGRALLEGRAVHIADVETDPDYTLEGAEGLGGFHSVLGVPILREGNPVGVLALARSEIRPFTDKQIELVSTFADQAAIAIENTRLFEEVQGRTRELARSLEDLRAAQDRLVQTEKLASLGQLTAGIAHEIKNPLNFVNNFASLSVELVDELGELQQRGALDPALAAEAAELRDMLRSNLEKVVQHGKRADSIVKNMLLHSRAGSGERRRVDVNAIVEESLNLAFHGARAEGKDFNIDVETSLDAAVGEMELYPQEIARVLLNLVSNGFYAATRRKETAGDPAYTPRLTVSTRDLGNSIEIRVRDNGTGIPPEVKEKLFSPFFTTKPAGEGTGLGLSISHDIVVKQHGGSIDVEWEPDSFTEFRIVLPRGAPAVDAAED